MNCIRAIFLLLFTSIAQCHIVSDKTDPKSLLSFFARFDYKTSVESTLKSTSSFDTPRHSRFTINATLDVFKVRHTTHRYVARFENVRFDDPSSQNEEEASIRRAIAEKPFALQMNFDRILHGIYTDEREPKWSVDMKKGVSALLQLDTKHLSTSNKKAAKGYAFYGEEGCLRGTCRTFSTVNHFNSTHVHVSKTVIQPSESSPHRERHRTLSFSSERDYLVENRPSGFLIKMIDAKNTVMLSPLKGFTDVHSVDINQVLKRNVTGEPNISDYTSFLASYVHLIGEYGEFHPMLEDYTFDESDTKSNDMYSIVDQAISSIVSIGDRLRKSNIELKASYLPDNETVNYAVERLKHLDVKFLENCFFSLRNRSEDGFRLFVNLLPQVATEAAVEFACKIISKNIINEDESISILKRMHTLPKNLSRKSLSLLSDIQETETIPKTVRNVAILASASMASKLIHENSEHESDKFVIDIIEKLNSSKDTSEEFLVYITALQNTKSKKAMEFLDTLIMGGGDTDVSSHAKALAIWCAKDMHMTNLPKLNRVHWPIVLNSGENLEVRMASLNVLMTDTQNFFKLYKYVKNERILYDSFYTQIKSLAHTTFPQFKRQATAARTILDLLDVGNENRIDHFNYIFDFFDSKYDVGNIITVSKNGDLHEDGFMSLYIQFSQAMPYSTADSDAIFVFIRPTKKGSIKSPLNRENFLSGAFSTDLITFKNYVVIQSRRFSSPGDYATFFKMFNDDKIKSKSMIVENHRSDEITILTDIGIPVSFFEYKPKIQMNVFQAEELKQLQHYSYQLKQHNHHVYGLKVYNPFTQVWQGSKHNHVLEVQLPIDITFNQTYIQINNEKDLSFGMKSFVYSEIFTTGSYQSQANSSVRVLNDKKSRQKKSVWKWENNYLGISTETGFFNCEQSTPPTSVLLKYLKHSLLNHNNFNQGDYPSVKILLGLLRFWSYFSVLPTKDKCGFGTIGQFNFDSASVNISMDVEDHIKSTKSPADVDLNILYEINRKSHSKRWNLNVYVEENERVNVMFVDDVPKKFEVCKASNTKNDTDIQLAIMYGKSERENSCPTNTSSIQLKATGNDYKEYRINYENISHDTIEMFRSVEDFVRNLFSDYFVRYFHKRHIVENTLKISLETTPDHINVFITSPQDNYAYKGIPMNTCQWKKCFKSGHYPFSNRTREIFPKRNTSEHHENEDSHDMSGGTKLSANNILVTIFVLLKIITFQF